MKYGIYSVKDSLIGFGKPHNQVNDAAAHREFKGLINSDEAFVKANFGDLELYRIGWFDDQSGIFEPALEFICSGGQVIMPKE